MGARRTILAIALVCGVAALAGCGGGDRASASVPEGRTAEEAQAGSFRLVKVSGNLGDALLVTAAPGQPGRLYVVQQAGRVRVVVRGRVRGTFLDVSGLIRAGGEQGLLGLAFHPEYARNGRFFVNYTDQGGTTRVVEYRRGANGRANPRSARRLLTIEQPYANHNGGHLAFGPDGYLYVATGDGGSGGDPEDNGQSPDTLLGKILRIDVDSRAARAALRHPGRQPLRARRRPPGDLRLRPPQPVALLVRPRRAATSGSATSGRARSRRSTSAAAEPARA